jgi:hypothetical protein
VDSDGDNKLLEGAFSILQFRRRGVASFRRFVILHAARTQNANDLHGDDAETQPLRVLLQ